MKPFTLLPDPDPNDDQPDVPYGGFHIESPEDEDEDDSDDDPWWDDCYYEGEDENEEDEGLIDE